MSEELNKIEKAILDGWTHAGLVGGSTIGDAMKMAREYLEKDHILIAKADVPEGIVDDFKNDIVCLYEARDLVKLIADKMEG